MARTDSVTEVARSSSSMLMSQVGFILREINFTNFFLKIREIDFLCEITFTKFFMKIREIDNIFFFFIPVHVQPKAVS